MKSLKELAAFLECKLEERQDTQIIDLEVDSRKIVPGAAFVAVKGKNSNGLDFAVKAGELGAVAVIVENDNQPSEETLGTLGIPVLVMPKGLDLGGLGAWFYDRPSEKIKLVGITGTNGKSTVTQLIAQYLGLFGIKCAVLGTLGIGLLPKLEKTANTTLDPIRLQRSLSRFLDEGIGYAALEVSSIGAVEGRVNSCKFCAGAFTNLTRDHLDFHKSMENYAAAKEMFLKMVPESRLSVNVDDRQGRVFADKFSSCRVFSRSKNFFKDGNYALTNPFVLIKDAVFKPGSTRLEIETFEGSGSCEIKLLGGFNVENFACALSVMLSLDFPLDRLLEKAPRLKPVCGRMECFKAAGKPHIVVDYAHTPDGIEQVLRAVKEHHPTGKIWCVAGCGGDRDKGKRPLMAIKASVFADKAIFTSDNPRSEDPDLIIQDMLLGVVNAGNVIAITDRLSAIKYAFEHAAPEDCVVIAGKGHEDYQIQKDKTVHFSDREIAAKLLGVDCD